MRDEDKPCWECENLDDMGGCKLNDCINPVWITEEETNRFKCFKFDKVAVAYRRVSAYIKRCGYTHSVYGVVKNYRKYFVKGYYVSCTMEDVINKCKIEVSILARSL